MSLDPPINNNIGTLFNEISGPITRLQRQVVFPNDEATTGVEIDNVEEVGGDGFVGAIDGRALKQTLQTVTKIDVGIQSQLLVAPGSSSIIYFEITNLRSEPTYHSFDAQDEKRYLRWMEPRL